MLAMVKILGGFQRWVSDSEEEQLQKTRGKSREDMIRAEEKGNRYREVCGVKDLRGAFIEETEMVRNL